MAWAACNMIMQNNSTPALLLQINFWIIYSYYFSFIDYIALNGRELLNVSFNGKNSC